MFNNIFVEKTVLIIKPEAVAKESEISNALLKFGFNIINRRKVHLTPEVASDFYREFIEETLFFNLIEAITCGPCVIYCLARKSAVHFLKQLVGPADVVMAKRTNPDCLRAIYGLDRLRNGLHASSNRESSDRELRFFFSSNLIIEPLMNKLETEDYLE
ncbi:unnamed protein product [Dimorphilus gyrociliatus]|uniref:Nucleoside diphosphate kinase-like domain-containing protein n=1 Tax=Dimorphilus gyrociliatus TaxID=2664684 RepID=A0A7I8V7Q6_9ANNE|nr:unnamed protein product [Dimorphilus gyrociliatus]